MCVTLTDGCKIYAGLGFKLKMFVKTIRDVYASMSPRLAPILFIELFNGKHIHVWIYLVFNGDSDLELKDIYQFFPILFSNLHFCLLLVAFNVVVF